MERQCKFKPLQVLFWTLCVIEKTNEQRIDRQNETSKTTDVKSLADS